MNAIELLKEAMDASVRVLDGLNARIDRASKQGEPIPVRVPMKMLTEIFNNAVDWVPIGDSERVDKIAAKYGVKVDG